MSKNIIIVILAIAVIGLAYYMSTRKCFYLPTSGEPADWGPWYWKSLHEIGSFIPCEECRTKGSAFLVFMHDMVNFKKKSKIYDEKNFSFWIKYIKSMPDPTDPTTDTAT